MVLILKLILLKFYLKHSQNHLKVNFKPSILKFMSPAQNVYSLSQMVSISF